MKEEERGTEGGERDKDGTSVIKGESMQIMSEREWIRTIPCVLLRAKLAPY
jgi:hypothetical protein